MFAKKSVTILDKNYFKSGHFITYCYMDKHDYGATVKEGNPMNAIISTVEDTYISVFLSSGDKKVIKLEQLIEPDEPTFDNQLTKIKIHGVRHNAI